MPSDGLELPTPPAALLPTSADALRHDLPGEDVERSTSPRPMPSSTYAVATSARSEPGLRR